MSSSRILTAAALVSLIFSACSGPGNGGTGPGAVPQMTTQSGSQAGVDKTAGVNQDAGVAPDLTKVRLFWRPDRLTLTKGEKQTVKLFYSGRKPLLIADDCTGKVVLGQIGFARIKRYHINIYQALALRAGPFRCAAFAKVRDEHRRAVLHIEVQP